MAPKRKRNERSSVDAGGDNRPSPHRPQNAALALHDRGDMRDGGQRRSSRGGQGGAGGRGGRRNDSRDNQNKLNISGTGRATPTPGPMSPPPRPSSAAATPTQTPTPTTELPSPIPKPDPAPYYYEFLTEDRIASWETTGRAEVIAAGTQARQDEDPMDLASVIQEFTRATLDGHIDPVEAGSCLREILGPQMYSEAAPPNTFDPHTHFLDIISIMYEAEEGLPNPALRSFAIASGVSAAAMRQKLDAKMLQDLGLTRDTFIRVGVRQATNLLYRQANYNLLREETEGYSKLVTELFTTSGSEPPSKEVVEDTFERVKALIGTFDLDVGRVLDITLDVFAAVLVKHFRFFVKLLRISSWWPRAGELDSTMRHGGLPRWALPASTGWLPTEEDEELSKQKRMERDLLFWDRARKIGLDAFFELGSTPIIDEETKQRLLNARGSGDADLDADRAWIEATGTLPPSGNRVAAQLLGFKLRFYASEARDKEDALPANLIYLAALLIKIGFISLRDLYPHLWPLDQDMPALRDARMKELAEKERAARGGGDNALTRAGALSDDSVPPSSRTREAAAAKSEPVIKPAAEAEDNDKLDEPSDQKVQLLTCLLTIGAIPEAMFILGRFPWLPEACPDLLDLINRILHHSIDHVYRTAEPAATLIKDCTTLKVADVDQSGMPKGQVRITEIPAKKQLRWPFPDKFDTNDCTSYRFYWDEWADNVPVCRTAEDMFTLCDTFLGFAGPSIGKDAALLSKLVRIGNKSLAEDQSHENLGRWESLLKRLLVPALSITKGNTQIANEIWDLLRFYPLSVRYSIYGEWFQGATSRLPAVKAAFARTKAETINTMKRISKNNIPSMARTLAKTTYSSPGVVFEIALGQIEAYTNLTEVVVECAKYFTDLGFDVLVWSLMVALGGKNRNRTNEEFALLPSKWLLALSTFSGKVFKRYGIMNLSPVLRYVNDQLYRGNSTDLVILKELISQMAGVLPDTDYNDSQVIAMTGGEALRKYTLIDLQDKRFESLKTGKRLLRNLTDSKLAGELLISIAQHRQAAIYKIPDEDAHIKLLATMIDDTQMILSLYLDFLRSNLSVEDFDEQVPGIPELLTDFGLEPALAFMIGRGSVAYYRSRAPKSVPNGVVKTITPSTEAGASVADADADAEGDVKMDGEDPAQANGEPDASETAIVNGSVVKEDASMADVKEETHARSASASEPPHSPIAPSGNTTDAIIETIKHTLPESTFKAITPEFYVTFWTSALSDLAVPQRSYDAIIDRLIEREKQLSAGSSSRSSAGRARENERKVVSETRETLFLEMKKLVGGASMRKSRLLKNKSSWFSKSMKADDISDTILEKCLLSRILLSPVDAEYCFKIIRFLHDNGVPHFRTLSLYGRFFRSNRLRSIIFTCTVREAENLGRFIRLVLADLARWHANAALYQKEAWGSGPHLPGFAKALDEDGKPKGFLDHDGDKGFKNILYFWHKNLNTAIRDCLEGTEWMHIRNAITILKSVVEVFPAVDFQGNAFIKQLEVIAKREKGQREDLALTGNAVLVSLKRVSKTWVMVQAFGHSMIPVAQTNGAQAGAKPATANASRSSLKPTAPEFKTQSRASSLGVAAPNAQHTMEVEDGEVDDAKTSAHTIAAPTSAPSSKVVDPKPDVPRAIGEPRKSEILDRRDQIKRDNAAKASTPPPSHASIPPRPDSARGSILDRASPGLPNRPDAPFPSRDLIDRHPLRHGDRRDGRDSRLSDPRGLDRASNRPGERPREYPGGDRRAVEPTPREFGRSSDRGLGSERDRTRPDPPPRWTADSARESHDRPTNGSRTPSDGRLSRDMPPPRSSAQPSDNRPAVNPERSPLVNPERQELINPERAALISGDKDVGRSESPRHGREDTRERGSRPQSPRRHASEKDHFDSRRDDRSTRNAPLDTHANSRGRGDDSQPPPAGPRSDRTAERERPGPTDRSSFQPSQPLPRNMDLDHGRLNSNTRPQPDPNFGRLNPAPASDIPSGPRDRNSRGNRPSNAPAPRRDGRPNADIPRPPTPDKQPPTGPAGGRHPRRSASGQFDPINTTIASVPTTPSVASPATGIHPDRLKALGSSVPQQPVLNQPGSPAASGPIHPDRLRALNNETPVKPQPQRQMNNDRTRPNVPPVVTAPPPSGPKGSQPSPTIPQNGFAAPTGPASATERAARGGRRQLAGINTMLQQAGQQGPDRINPRGRGRMSSGIGPDTPISAPFPPSVPPPPPPPGPPPARETGRDLINLERADLITNVVGHVEERDRDRTGRRERSGRHSRRNSRSPARERDAKRGPEDERSLRNEYRDRSDRPRGERGEPEKERHQSRSSPSRDSGSREVPSGRDSGRERDRERDRDREGSRREGRERDTAREPHDAAWGGERGGSERGPGGRTSRDTRGEVRGDERRDSRGARDDGARKRHSDEGLDSRGRDSKRIRR